MFRLILASCLLLQLVLEAFEFPKDVHEMENRWEEVKKSAETKTTQILLIPSLERTFENTALAYDLALTDFQIFTSTVSLMKLVHPNPEIRQAAEEILLKLTALSLDLFESNPEIYKALCSLPQEGLNLERQYYLSKLHQNFKNRGMLLSSSDLDEMKRLQNKISALCIQFRSNIDADESTLCLNSNELAGLNSQLFDQNGEDYIIPCTAANASQILKDAACSTARQKCYQTYRNRAYPQNLILLKEIIELRQKLATLLGYENYAAIDLSSEMAKTPKRVHEFISELAEAKNKTIQNNWKLITQDLPESVRLTPEGKVNPWDASYLFHTYSKRHFDLDANLVAEHFPFSSTLKGILRVFSEFFSLQFKIQSHHDLWDPSVIVVEVKDKETLIGHVILDLFSRKNKFSHACCSSIIPPMSKDGGKTYEPALAAIVANVPSSLLKFSDVKTLLHEFGHAMHALLGRSEMPSQAAYNTPIDFAEAPSQLMEEWGYCPEVLKKISSHYETGQPLADSMIQALQKSRSFGDGGHIATGGSGDHLASLLQYSLFSLKIHEESCQDFEKLTREIYQTSPQVIAYTETPYYCSFGHLAGYDSKYYCYAWSKQLALQLFDYINSRGGPLDPAMGRRYRSKVLEKGGSVDPNELMADFLQGD